MSLPFSRLLAPVIMALGAALLGTAAQAQVYQQVEVRGAELVPEEDIARTCGELTGIEIDEMTRQSVEECLMLTGVFERVALRGEGDRLIIDVTEIETRPGRLDFGIAWESDIGLTGTIAYEQFNLIPQTFLAIRSSYSREYRSYELAAYRREALGLQLHFGLQVTGSREEFDDLSYARSTDRAEAYLAWTPTEALRGEFALGYRRQQLSDVAADVSALLHREAGRIEAPYVHFVLGYSTPEEAARGGSLRLEHYLWNLGTDSRVAETRLEARLRQPLPDEMLLLAGLRGGWVRGLDGYAPGALDRAYLGGENLRGFAPRGLGPKDRGDHLGGTRYAAASLELQRPLWEAFGMPLRGGIFVEAGSLWGLDDDLGGRIDDRAHLRSSFGLTLSFDVGQVPVSLYLAQPMQYRSGDLRQSFGLSAAARF